MSFNTIIGGSTTTLSIAFISLAVLGSIFLYLFYSQRFPSNAPKLASEAWPIVGSHQFFTNRADFFDHQVAHSRTGNFSFYAGDKPIIGLSGDYARKVFFENKSLGFAEGYAALLGGSPKVNRGNKPLGNQPNVDEEDGFSHYFTKRLVAMLKGPVLARSVPQLVTDLRGRLDELTTGHITDPFDSIYRVVFQLTMRTVACNEIAGDRAALDKTLQLFETIEATATPFSIMYNWLPVPARFKRTYAGAQLYMMLKQVMDARQKEGRNEGDALQFLMDQGDDLTKIITFILGALFAGQLNSGINAAWLSLYLAKNKTWYDRVREELETVADRYCSDKSLTIKERLMDIPVDVWENGFPTIDLCLKESIRLQLLGSAFRKNISGHDIPLNKAGTEVIPPDAYVAWHTRDVHMNPDIYENPEEWDPSRYLPERAEDKKREYAWMGWGVARHPCLGMKFAKMEMSMLIAFFMAYFEDLEVVNEKGEPRGLPPININSASACKPLEQVFLKYKVRQD